MNRRQVRALMTIPDAQAALEEAIRTRARAYMALGAAGLAVWRDAHPLVRRFDRARGAEMHVYQRLCELVVSDEQRCVAAGAGGGGDE